MDGEEGGFRNVIEEKDVKTESELLSPRGHQGRGRVLGIRY